MKIFQKNLMASEDVKAYLGTGVFYKGAKQESIHDGAIVVVGDLEDHSVYAGIKDVNVRKLTAPAAATDKVVIVDYVGVSNGEIMGNTYREGVKTAGLTAPKGERVRYRVPQVGDTFYLGTGNFDKAPTIGQFAGVTATDTILTVEESAPVSGFGVKIEDKKTLTEGTVDTDTLYFCRVVSIA